MACAWENKQRCVEVCLGDIGNYVYVGFDTPGVSLIEVSQDLSGYVNNGVVGSFPLQSDKRGRPGIFSKARNVFRTGFDTATNPDTSYISRHDGAGTFSVVSTAPNLRDYLNHPSPAFVGGRIRATDWGPNGSLYTSDDGETWTVVAGPLTGIYAQAYTVLGSRLVAALDTGGGVSMYYSDNNGASWQAASGGGGSWPEAIFFHAGSNILRPSYGDFMYITTDGATWTVPSGVNSFSGQGYEPRIATDGSGTVIATGFTTQSVFARSTNDGASWSMRTFTDAGVPTDSGTHGIFWDGAQFVCFVDRSDTGNYQIYTSPTGLTWTAGLIIPEIIEHVTQIID